jgi:hypothetical protein
MLRIIEFILCVVSDVTVQVQLLQLEKYDKIRSSGRTNNNLLRLVALTELWQESCKIVFFRQCNLSCIRYSIPDGDGERLRWMYQSLDDG